MKGKRILTLVLALVAALAVATLVNAGPGQATGRGSVTAPPEIQMGMFVNRPFSSPWWYPPEEETDRYQWGPPIRWANPTIGVLVNPTEISTDGGVQSAAYYAVEQGFAQWNSVDTAYSAAVERDGGVGPSLDAPDGTNTVSWGEIDGEGGIIAVTYFWYYVNTKELIDCDIVFDSEETWSISAEEGSFDVWNIATHEAGHTLVLADLRSPKDGALTMHAYTWPGDDFKRTLGIGDILGIQAIYGE